MYKLLGPSAAKAARKEQKHKSRSTMRAKDGTHDDSRRRTSAERQRLSCRYARPASRFPARPGALPCSLRRIPFDRPAMLRMYRGLDGRSTLSKCSVQEPSAAEGSQCDAVALAGSPCHQWLCGHKQGWPGPSFDHMSGLRHRDIRFSRLSLLEFLIIDHTFASYYVYTIDNEI